MAAFRLDDRKKKIRGQFMQQQDRQENSPANNLDDRGMFRTDRMTSRVNPNNPSQRVTASSMPAQNDLMTQLLDKNQIPTTQQMYGSIYQTYQRDPDAGKKMMDDFHYYQTEDPTSPWYNPYLMPTATEKQYVSAEPRTQKAEAEWAQLQQEIFYWAQQSDRNYSNEEIRNHINMKKYPTLAEMDEKARLGDPLKLNRAIGYSQDAIDGIIWAARNDGGYDNPEMNMAMSALGEGNQWKEDPEITARKDKESKSYNEYWIGSTLDDERAYFGVSSFDQAWMDENYNKIMAGSNETAKKHAMNVFDAFDRTQKAKAEKAELDQRMAVYLKTHKDPVAAEKWLTKQLDSGKYPTLAAMDKSIAKRSPMGMTEAVQYGWNDYLKRIQDGCMKNAEAGDSVDEEEKFLDMTGVVAATAATGAAALGGTATAISANPAFMPANGSAVTSETAPAVTPSAAPEATQAPAATAVPTATPSPENTPMPTTTPAPGPAPTASSTPTPTPTPTPTTTPAPVETPEAAAAPTAAPTAAPAETLADAAVTAATAAATATADAASASVPSAPRRTEAEKEEVRTKDRIVQAGFDAVEGVATESEKRYMQSAPSTNFRRQFNAIMNYKRTSTGAMGAFNRYALKKSVSTYSEAVLNYSESVADYEAKQKIMDEAFQRRHELEQQLGDKIYYGMDPEFVGGEVPVTVDGYDVNLTLIYDPGMESYYVDRRQVIVPGESSSFSTDGMSEDAKAKLAALEEETIKRENERRQQIANGNAEPLTEAEAALFDEYKALVPVTNAMADEQAKGADKYNEESRKLNAAKDFRNATLALLWSAGVPQSEIDKNKNIDVVIDYLMDFGKADPAQWEAYSMYDELSKAVFNTNDLMEAMEKGEEFNKENESLLQLMKWVMDYSDRSGIVMPEATRKKLQGYIDKAEYQKVGYKYFKLQANGDYKEKSKAGRSLLDAPDWTEYENGTKGLEELPAWNLLTDEQKMQLQSFAMSNDYIALQNQYKEDTDALRIENRLYSPYIEYETLLTPNDLDNYYYLLSTEGTKAADQYTQFLGRENTGILSLRHEEALKAGAKDLADSGFFGRRAADVASMVLSPVAALGSLGYAIEYGIRKLNGENPEFNPRSPWLATNIFRNAAREEITNEIKRIYGEDTLLGKAVLGFQEMVSNRGDSMMNAATFGWIFGGIETDLVKEFVGSIPMASTAAMDAMSEASDKGANEGQIFGIGLVTLLSESVTEAITLGNIQEAFKMGADIKPKTVKDFLKNWFTKNGIEEMFGESVTDIVERAADEKIMGVLSEHHDLVEKYKALGMNDDDAEAAARKDEMSSLLHTALISFLSPGLDIVPFSAGRFAALRMQTKDLQQSGYNVSIFDVMKIDNGEQRQNAEKAEELRRRMAGELLGRPRATSEQATAPAEGAGTAVPENSQDQTAEAAPVQNPEQTAETAPVQNMEQTPETAQTVTPVQGTAEAESAQEAEAEQRPENPAAKAFAKDWEILQYGKNAEPNTRTSSIAAVLTIDESNEASDLAMAAAVNISNAFPEGTDAIDAIGELLQGAADAGVDPNKVKQAIINAATCGKFSSAWNLINGSEFYMNKANAQDKATMLAHTVDNELATDAMAKQKEQAVREMRIAEAEKEVIATGVLDNAQAAQDAAERATDDRKQRETIAEERQEKKDRAISELNAAVEAQMQDPQNPEHNGTIQQNSNKVQGANDALTDANRELEGAQKREADAKQTAAEEADKGMAEVRRQSTEIINQEDQQRAEAASQQAEAEKRQVELEAQQKADQEAADNANTADVDSYIEQYYPDATEEEKQKIREVFDRVRNEQPAASMVPDANGQLNPEAKKNRDKFIRRVSKKFGVTIDVVDTTQGGRVDRQNGYVDVKTGRIVLDETATTDDAMFFVLGHELTHIAEQSGTYDQLARTLVRMRYGDDAGRLAADIRARKNLYDTQLARMHEQDNTIDATPLTEEQAGQEIVADIMGDLLRGDQELCNRLVAEEPSLARRIIDSIKSFIKKAVGMKGAWLNDAQRTVDMLESALKEAQNKSAEQIGETKHSLEALKKVSEAVREKIQYLADQSPFAKEYRAWNRKKDSTALLTLGRPSELLQKYGVPDVDIKISGGKIIKIQNDHPAMTDNVIRQIPSILENPVLIMKSLRREQDTITMFGELVDKNGYPVLAAVAITPTLDEKTGIEFAVLRSAYGKDQNTQGFIDKSTILYKDETRADSWAATMGLQLPSGHTQIDSSGQILTPENSSVKRSIPEFHENAIVKSDDGETLASELPGGTVAVNTDRRYSLNSFTPEERARVRSALIKSKRFTPREVDRYLDNALGLANMIAADKARLDFEASDVHTMLKPNNDYKYTVDASTLCAKRLLYQGTFNEIQRMLPNTPLLPEDLVDLTNMMREMGYETPCGICYVESRRRHLGKFAQEWLDEYKGEYKPTLSEVTTSDGLEALRVSDDKSKQQTYRDFVAAMNKKGVANPKVVQLRTDYRGEIRDLHPATVRSLINHGGLRLQSFSDFETPHLLDMVQVVMDMSAKGLTSQAYTKVPNFAWAFGDTGIKINLSLIGKGSGLDENGNLIFDDVEGMPFEEAIKLRDRYSKNVGTILVGMNDEHIIAAMGDPRIDFIIPFHKSGWSQAELDRMPVLNSYNDYTETQNEKKIKGRKADGSGYETYSADDYKIKNFEPVGRKDKNGKGTNGYWDFSKSGEENAIAYLQMCADDGRLPKFYQFLTDNGDGSFSLPEGTDARSTAIREGYWKTLTDFKMYDNDGVGSPQMPVTPNINMAEAQRILNEYSLDRNGINRKDNNSLPVAQPVVDRYVEEFKEKHPLGEDRVKYSLPEWSASDEEYADAVASGDLQKATNMLMEKLQHSENIIPFNAPHGYGGQHKDIAKMIKEGTPEAVAKAAADMASYVPSNAVLIPMPDHSGKVTDQTDTMILAKAIGDLTGRPVVAAMEGNDRESRFAAKSEGRKGASEEELGFRQVADIPEGTIPIFVDNVVGSGVTANAAEQAFGGGITLAYAKSTRSKGIEGLKNLTITYDSDGNLIPLSQRLDASKRDVRYSLPVQPSDAPYLSAINHGDMETVQRMVDEKAKEAGYSLETFHGTGEYFNEFRRGYEGIHLGNEFQASQIAEMRYTHRSKNTSYAWGDIKNRIYEMNNEQREAILHNAYLMQDYFDDGQSVPEFDGDLNNWRDVARYVRDIVNRYAKVSGDNPDQIRMRTLTFDRKTGEHVMRLYAKINNPFTINGDIGQWDPASIAGVILRRSDGEDTITSSDYKTIDISGSNFELTDDQRYNLERLNNMEIQDNEEKWDVLSDVLNEMGFDGIKYLNTYEGDRNSYSYIALKQSDVKSADPITYDDNGRVIPLSERFDINNPDIRYSLPSDNLLEQQIRQYLSGGGSLSTNVTPPVENLPGTPGMRPQRQFGSKTAQGSDALHDEVKEYLYNHSSYTPETNQEQIDRSIDWVRSMATESDPEGYHKAVDEVTSEAFDYRSADGQAKMLTVMGMAAMKGDIETEMRLADAYNRQGTDLGRALQSRKIFRMMTPVGRMGYFQKQVDSLNDEIGQKTGRRGQIKLDEWTMRAIGAAESEEDFEKVRKAVAKQIGEQIPASWQDKFRSWRMLAMLGNPRTHIRNIIGNAMFIPAVSIKNKLGAVAELGMDKGNRTKTIAPVVSKEIRDFARQDAIAMRDTLTGEAKYNEEDLIEQERRKFKGVLQALSDFNSNALEAEDWFFLKGHYRRALGGWMQANGYTPEQMRNNPELLEQGRAYAIKEAQKATYRDFNGLAKKLSDLSRNPETFGQKALGFVTEAVLPFKKTPANILKRGLEYSPVGVARALTTDLIHLKQYSDYQKGKLDTLPKTAITPNQFIDNLCSGLTGSAIMAVGALLGSMGVVSVGLDDDDDEFEKLKGNQPYAIKISIGGEDYTFTMDWAAPMCMPFFVGAAIQEQAENQDGYDIDALINAMGNITEPVFNLSMLDGVNSLLDMFTAGDDTNATITQLGAKVLSNYGTSYIPSIVGAAARTIDTTRRKSFVESGKGSGILGTFRYAMEQVENKIPGLSQSNIPYRDVWGNAEESGLAERILENFVLPGYINAYKDDAVVSELAALGKAPREPGKTFSAGGEKYILTDKQWDAYKVERGQTAYNLLGELFGTEAYLTANEDEKGALVDDVWTYANNKGKVAAIPDADVGNWEESADPVGDIIAKHDAKKKDNRVTANKNNMITALNSGDIEGFETMVEALRQDGVSDESIKERISKAYRDQYKEAYRNDDFVRMDEIEEMLDSTGFSFNLSNWEKAVDNEDTTGSVINPGTAMASAGPAAGFGGNEELLWQNLYSNTKGKAYGKGNIDLNSREVVQNDDGSISTEASFSFYDEDTGKEVLIPTVINGQFVSEDEAIEHYYQTGEYLGLFDTPEEADEYAERLHNRQDWYYNR